MADVVLTAEFGRMFCSRFRRSQLCFGVYAVTPSFRLALASSWYSDQRADWRLYSALWRRCSSVVGSDTFMALLEIDSSPPLIRAASRENAPTTAGDGLVCVSDATSLTR